jgi:hypothetical protein
MMMMTVHEKLRLQISFIGCIKSACQRYRPQHPHETCTGRWRHLAIANEPISVFRICFKSPSLANLRDLVVQFSDRWDYLVRTAPTLRRKTWTHHLFAWTYSEALVMAISSHWFHKALANRQQLRRRQGICPASVHSGQQGITTVRHAAQHFICRVGWPATRKMSSLCISRVLISMPPPKQLGRRPRSSYTKCMTCITRAGNMRPVSISISMTGNEGDRRLSEATAIARTFNFEPWVILELNWLLPDGHDMIFSTWMTQKTAFHACQTTITCHTCELN